MVLHIAPWQPSLSSQDLGGVEALQQQQEDKPEAVGAQKDPKRENPAADSSHKLYKNHKYKIQKLPIIRNKNYAKRSQA